MARTKQALKTVLTFVQDETGSMHGVAETTRSAFNEYFKTLKNDKEIGEVEAVVWQFSDAPGEDRVRLLFEGPVGKVPKLTEKTYRPRGVTPLLDAVGTALKQAEGKEADRYLFIVQTDGLENASRDFKREQIAKLVAKKEKAKNWTLVFLGAGIDNWTKESAGMGVVASSSVAYETADGAAAYGSLGQTSSAFLRTASPKAQTLGSDTEKGIEEQKKKKQKSSTPKS